MMPKGPSELDNGQVAVLTLKSLMSHLELGLTEGTAFLPYEGSIWEILDMILVAHHNICMFLFIKQNKK